MAAGLSLRRALMWGTAGVLLVALSGLGTFLWLTTQLRPAAPARTVLNAVQIEEARAARAYANRLAGLVEAYVAQIPLNSPGPTPGTEAWVKRRFTALLRELREDLARTPRADPELLPALETAIERVTGMTRHPGDGALRRMTVAEIRRTLDAVEQRLTDQGARPYLGEPARLPGF